MSYRLAEGLKPLLTLATRTSEGTANRHLDLT
jgi:hypothetical protein